MRCKYCGKDMEVKKMSEEEKDIELKALGGFTGTEHWYKLMGAQVTDGVQYIMENGYAWLVTDMLAVLKSGEFPELDKPENWFKSIKLKLFVDQRRPESGWNHSAENMTATATIEDGNGKVLYSQEYKWTDAKVELVLYFVDNVLMLAGEY